VVVLAICARVWWGDGLRVYLLFFVVEILLILSLVMLLVGSSGSFDGKPVVRWTLLSGKTAMGHRGRRHRYLLRE
jgi:hypothetical protein